jgi:uncharacterized protein with GYD domain
VPERAAEKEYTPWRWSSSRKKLTKEAIAQNLKLLEMGAKEGGENHGISWTLGRHDAIGIFEAPKREGGHEAFNKDG